MDSAHIGKKRQQRRKRGTGPALKTRTTRLLRLVAVAHQSGANHPPAGNHEVREELHAAVESAIRFFYGNKETSEAKIQEACLRYLSECTELDIESL